MKKRILSLILTLCTLAVLAAAFATAAFATSVTVGDFTVTTDGTLGTDYSFDATSGVLTVLSATSIKIENTDKTTATSHRIVVASGVSANITLAGVNIECSSGSPFEIAANSTGNVTITLADGTTNTLMATRTYAALQKEGSGTNIGKLTIQGKGELIADTTGTAAAAIGSHGAGLGSSADVSNITITGGKIMATGGAAGIGSGTGTGYTGNVSNIVITGGIVTATANSSSAGIGSGYSSGISGTVSDIIITGGTVTATSTYGAGIGCGEGDATGGGVSNIVISGGSVKATGKTAIGKSDGTACTPTDGNGNDVSLYPLNNPDGKAVTVDGKSYPAAHTYYDGSTWQTENKVYLYLTGNEKSITVGDTAHTIVGSALVPLSGTCGDNGDNVTWTFDAATGTLTIGGSGKMAGYGVSTNNGTITSDNRPWKDLINQIKKVVIEDGVTSIGQDAFVSCTNMASIELSNSVTSIEQQAFYYCTGLTSITIPKSVTIIYTYAFQYCNSLKNVVFKGNVRLGGYTFKNCAALENIYFFGDVLSIHEYAFSEANSQIKLYGYTDNTNLITFCNNNNKTFIPLNGTCGDNGDNVTWTFDAATGTLTISGSGKMADYTYSGSDQPWAGIKDMIKKIVIEDGVTSIGASAFKDCSNVESVTFQGDVQRIGDYAFYDCDSLTGLVIPGNVGSIGEYAFAYNEKMTEITFMGDVASIARNAFRCGEAVTKLTFNGNIGSIDEYAFEYCKALTEIRFMDNVVSIGYSAFCNCEELTDVFFAGNVGSIGDYAFGYDKKLANVYCFGSVNFVDEDAFYGCVNIFNLYCYTDNFILRAAPTEKGRTFIPLDGEDNGVTWRLAVDGTLIVRGDLSGLTAAPWKTLDDEGMIKNVVIYGSATDAADLFVGTYHTVTFKTDDTTDYATILVADGETIPTPADPTKAGYIFAGWYNGETKYDFTAAVTADLTLTAKWEKPDYVGTLEEAQNELKTKVEELNTALNNKANTSTLESKIADVNAAIAELQTALNGKASQAELTTLSDSVTTLQNAITALQSAQSTTDTAISAINAAQTAQNTAIEELKKRLDAAESKITDLINNKADATDLADAITELATLTSTIDKLDKKVTDLSTALAAAQTTLIKAINDLTDRVKTAEGNITALTDNKASKDELETAVDELKVLIKALDDVKDAYKGADDTLKADLQAKIDSANDALEAAVNRIAALESAVSDIEQQIAALETAKKQLEQDLATKASTDDVTKSIDALNTALSEAKAALEATDATNRSELEGKITAAEATLQAAVDKFASDLAAAKAELETKDAELEAKNASLETFIVVVCVIACVALAGNVVIVVMTFGAKRKHG